MSWDADLLLGCDDHTATWRILSDEAIAQGEVRS